MKKKVISILALGCCLLTLAAGAACSNANKLDELREDGYTVSVTYDVNGGMFMNTPTVSTIMHLYNPSKYDDGQGNVSIPLTEPTEGELSSNTLTLADHFFAGWYQTRDVKEVNGVPVDENDRPLTQKEDGTYVYAELKEGEQETAVTPAYVYSDYWDFDEDRLQCKAGEKKEITLYAGWVQYYEFEYFYKIGNASEWKKYDQKTTFDYKATNAAGSTTSDKDTIWLPDWKNGAMNYDYAYENKSPFQFPKLKGTTFVKAYEDKDCTVEIGSSFVHKGTLDYETATAQNRVQAVYVLLEEGVKYQIQTAKQLADNPDAEGIYEIQADLDFGETDESGKPIAKWPTAFSSGTFNGKMYASEGRSFAIKNASVTMGGSATKGGLFGSIGEKAEIKNLSFENATVNLESIARTEVYFGLFAGEISEDATLAGVTVGGTLRLGTCQYQNNSYHINLLANGNLTGVTTTEIALKVYGEKISLRGKEYYSYTINPEVGKVTVDGDKNVSVEFSTIRFEDENGNGTYKAGILEAEYTIPQA